jgi:hypothetical protein
MERSVLLPARKQAGAARSAPPTRSLRRTASLAAVLLAASAVAGGLTMRAADQALRHQVPPPATAAAPAAGTPAASIDVRRRAAAVDAILKRRATAVLRHRPDLFLADVDRRDERLVTGQRTLYANLVQFGFDRLRYLPVREQFDAALLDRRGPSAYAVQVVMDYRIKDIDATPVHTLVGYTFVQLRGRWVLTADDDLDTSLPFGSHREPWDTGPVMVRRAPRVLVVVEPDDQRLARSLVRDARSAVRAVSRRWPRGWKGAGLVIALRDRWVRTADYTVEKNAEDAVAMATAVYRTLPGETSSDGERAASYVVVNPRFRTDLGARVLAHEFTHVVTAPYGGNAPRWLVEGVADYIEYLPMDGEPDLDLDRYRAKVRYCYLAKVGRLPADQVFYASVVSSYAIGWYAVDWLMSRYGPRAVADLYDDLAGHGFDQVQRDRIMATHLGMTETGLIRALKQTS